MSKTFAVLTGDIVSNVIVADSAEIAESLTNQTCVEYTPENPAQIGWIYNAETEEFIFPAPAEETPAE